MASTQIVPQVVPFPQSTPRETISQLELELLISLRNRAQEIQKQVETEESALWTRLEARRRRRSWSASSRVQRELPPQRLVEVGLHPLGEAAQARRCSVLRASARQHEADSYCLSRNQLTPKRWRDLSGHAGVLHTFVRVAEWG